MELEHFFRMKGGDDETSYANRSKLQMTVISMVKPILEKSLVEFYCREYPECLRVADLGCSAGPNTLLVVFEIIDIISDTCHSLNRPPPSLQAFLNDLYGNDFNTTFKSLPSFYKRLREGKGRQYGPCFVSATPGSFFGTLFPANSLHFVHSSYAIMWMSKVPKGLVSNKGEALNKKNICIAKTSPPAVFEAYFEQFQRDFTLFLKCRAQELLPGGCMVLTTMGSINSTDPLSIWEVVGINLNDMVLEGLIEEEKLDRFDLPYYAATEDEVKALIEEEGSFHLQRLESINMDWDCYIKKCNNGLVKHERAKILARDIRAVGEPILAAHFGESVMDELFCRFEETVLDHMDARKCQFVNLVICLTKKD